ncbi:MAG: hypothetical protein PHT31_05555 [Candidatus Omnitrophica bacterium]|nr:hypothetical protein [Candidatus Omnitrophota bacterium]MDD5653603.1 hypothetical protein [Candidatus Omnitrophota bacterium]
MKDIKHRVITMLDRQELDFLDKLGKDALFSTGHKLSYNEILRGLIEFSREIGLSGNAVDSEKKLKEKIIEKTLGYFKHPKGGLH